MQFVRLMNADHEPANGAISYYYGRFWRQVRLEGRQPQITPMTRNKRNHRLPFRARLTSSVRETTSKEFRHSFMFVIFVRFVVFGLIRAGWPDVPPPRLEQRRARSSA